MVVWEPYNSFVTTLPEYCVNGQDIWRTMSPLICFNVAEWHLPNRVMRQFDMKQNIPEHCNTESDLHNIDFRSHDWPFKLGPYVLRWNLRRDFVAVDSLVGDEHTSPEYVFWYNNITRRYITPEGAAYGEARSCFSRIRDLSLDLEILNLCDKGDRNMEQLHCMYNVPAAPPRAPRRKGRAREQIDEQLAEVVHEEFHHNYEDMPHFTQTQDFDGSSTPMMMMSTPGSQFDIGASSSHAQESEEPPPPPRPRRQPHRNRRPPSCGTH